MEAWFQERPKWMQDAAYRLAKNGAITKNDISQLLAICNAEAVGQKVDFNCLPSEALEVVDMSQPLHLISIANVQGINALSPSKPLKFEETPLCIVYGRNGAGKSGYVRLLKHACGNRHAGDLLGNIFESNTQPQIADFTFIQDNQIKTSQWSGNTLPELQGVEIYDTDCGLVYVSEENEVAYEPWLLRLFTQLTNACTALSEHIQKQISEQVSKKPKFPDEFALTSAAKWYTNLTATTNRKDVNEQTEWKTEHNSELIDINKRLSEENPTAKATVLRRQKTLVLELKSDLKKYYDSLSNDCCNSYLQAKADAEAKRKAADEDASKVFEKAPLTGVGSESWRLLWDAARRYSEDYAYKKTLFPNVSANARCVLCQQELDQASRDRFTSFEAFVKSELQRTALHAEQNLQKLLELFAVPVTGETLAIKLEASGITDAFVKEMMTNFMTSLNERKQTCLASRSMAEIPELPTKHLLINLVQIARKYAAQARIYDKDAINENRPQLELKAKELSARKWLSQQRQAIDSEISRLIAIHCLQKANRLTNTQALSKCKSTLADELITSAYIRRFQDELENFKIAGINVELKKTRTQIGRVYHRIYLKNQPNNVKISNVLSEGEFRI
ncbi:MAG: hypothetical protein ABFD50_16590, partial [Smithella sp.]